MSANRSYKLSKIFRYLSPVATIFLLLTSLLQVAVPVEAADPIVTFNANGGTGTMANQTYNVPTALTVNAFTRVGYSFSGWNTVAGGTGTAYADGATYSFDADLTLYAQWSALATHTVTFNANGGTGTMANQTYNVPTALTVNAFTRVGYSFSGWNTVAGGTGTAYADGATYSFDADLTLYAQWSALATHTVTFNANGGTGTMANQTYNVPTALTVNAFTRVGYSFSGWNTVAGGTGTAYADGATYSFDADLTLYAQWSALATHTVTFNANGGTGTMANQTYNVPTALTVNAFTRVGYSFSGWNTVAGGTGTAYADGATYSFDADLTLYAQWSALATHTVTFNANGGTGTMANQTYNVPTALTVNAFTRVGYSFSGWNTVAGGTGTAYADGATYSFDADLTLYAQWSALATHTVTFNANGGTGTMANQTYNVPTALTVNAFTRVGYSFSGWNTVAGGTGTAYADGATYSFDADLTLYAQWSALATHTVTFNANGGTGTMANQTYNVPTALTVNAFTRVGYSFSGWNTVAGGTGTAYADGATYSFDADLTLYAQWSALATHTVTFNANGGTGTMANQTYNVPTALTVNAFTRVGYSFSGWNTVAGGTGTAYADGATYSFDADLTLYAQWSALATHTVTFNANGGTGTMANQTYNVPTALTVNAFTRVGYSFSGWNTVAGGTGTAYADGATYSFDADLTLYAQWSALATHTVTFNANGGTGTMANQTYNVPTALTVNAFTRVGYSFSGWNTVAGGTGTAYADGATYSFDADLTLYAQWSALATHTVTFNANGGTGTMANQTYNVPTALTVNAFTRVGYSFSGWNTVAGGTGTAYADGATYSFDADLTLYAQWSALATHTVTFNANGGTGTMANQTYNVPTALTVNAFTRVGYSFSGWNTVAGGTGTAYADGATYSFDADLTLYAQWSALATHTVTFNANGGTGTMANQTYNVPTALTVNAFTRVGYSFSGWNTVAGGTGTAYADGATYSFDADLTLYAQWSALATHTVTFNANGGTGTMANQTYNVPTALTVNAFTRVGYSFSGWNTVAGGTGTAYADGATYSFDADLTLYAQWSALATHTVTFNANGGTGTMANQTYNVPTALTVNAFTRVGYSFSGWNTVAGGTGTAYADGATYSFDADLTLYAQWSALATHTVTFNANGGTGTMANQTYNVPTALTVNAFTRVGYSFSGWNTVAGGTGTAYADGATYSFDADLTLYAQWSTGSYTVTYDGNSSTSGTAPIDASSPYNFGATVTVLGNTGNLARTGYTFANWNTAANGSGTGYAPAATFIMGGANVTLYAQWTPVQYTITFDSAGGSTVTSITADFGAAVTPPTNPTRAGYTFAGWSPALPAIMPLNGAALTAQWTTVQYTITFDSAGGSTVTSITAALGAAVSAPTDPTRAGYTFAGWSPAFPATMPLNGLALTAQWTVNNYTVTFDNNGGAGVDPSTRSVAFGSLTIAPTTLPTWIGHNLSGWNTAANGSGTPWDFATSTMGATDVTLYAQWSTGSYTVTYAGNGSTSGAPPIDAGSPYNFGATVTVLGNTGNLAKTGYTFANWNTAANGSGTGYAPAATFIMGGANVTLYAQWTPVQYTITFDSAGGSAVAGQTIAYGGLITQPGAPTQTGYTFGGWFKDAAATDDWVFATDTVTSAVTLYAKWIVTSTGGGGGGGGFGNQLVGINLSGTSPWMDGNGRALTAGQIRTPDSRLNLTIPVGTAIWNAAGAAQTYLSAAALTELPQVPPEHSLVMAYEMGPTGVTFTPAITLTFNYTDNDIPAGTREADLYIAWWDGAKWNKLEGTVNPAANTVTVQVSHFTSFALLVPAAPPPSTAPTLKIGTPTAGASFDSGTVSISIITTNLALVANNRPNAAGEGRAIYYLDVPIPTTLGQVAFSTSGSYRETESWTNTWTDLAPGSHTLGVQLVQNDHTPFNPPVFATVTVIVKDAVIAPPTTSSPVVTQPSLPTTPSSELTKTNWGIPILFLVAAIALCVVLYWKSRRPVENLKYTNR